MKVNSLIVSLITLLALVRPVYADDFEMLKEKASIFVDQAKELYEDSFRKGSENHTPQLKYYYKLILNAGTNLTARSESPINKSRLSKYIELVSKDFDVYTKYAAAKEIANATGNKKGTNDGRARAKRRINAEKLGEKELISAIQRWENFNSQIKRDPKKR